MTERNNEIPMLFCAYLASCATIAFELKENTYFQRSIFRERFHIFIPYEHFQKFSS